MPLLHLLLPVLLALAPPPRPEVAASAVLHEWDARRASAWAAEDPAALRALYPPGSALGRSDVRALRAWSARGLRVEGLQVQLLRIGVRRAGPDRLELLVTDRLAGAVAVGDGSRRPLRRGEVSTRVLVLVRAAGDWRLAQARAVATTSSTVRSRNE